jgi:integrase/recombinase XerD
MSTAVAVIPEGNCRRSAKAGEKGRRRFIEFFTAKIENPNTRDAYARDVRAFFAWCDERGLTELAGIEPLHIAAYREHLKKEYATQTVKRHLSAIRELFDWLVEGHVMEVNPALSVKGPRYSLKKGLTPVLGNEEARQLLDSIDVSTVVGLRDRAVIAFLTYTFARVSAAVNVKVEDLYLRGRRWRVRLHEKNGAVVDVACHHNLEEYLFAYMDAAGLRQEKGTPLFRSAVGKTNTLTERPMHRNDVLRMIWRRAEAAGLSGAGIGCHTFGETGITAYLKGSGRIEVAQKMAGHGNAKTTSLYDRRDDDVTLDEVARIAI